MCIIIIIVDNMKLSTRIHSITPLLESEVCLVKHPFTNSFSIQRVFLPSRHVKGFIIGVVIVYFGSLVSKGSKKDHSGASLLIRIAEIIFSWRW
jgi:hypothetical protein